MKRLHSHHLDKLEEENTAMPERTAGLVQGTLDMLILKTLALEPMHGYGIALRIEQISRGVFQVNAGSLFPAFRRLERDGLVAPEWRPTENNRRAKYYRLTELGTAVRSEEHTSEIQSRLQLVCR